MSEPVIDEATLRELQDAAGADFVSELVSTFLAEAPGMLGALRLALTQGDADGFRRAAHSLKSNGQTFGATRLAELARELELGGLAALGGSGDATLERLAQALDEAAAALQALCDGR